MQKFIIAFAICLAVAAAFEVYEDEDGQEYLLVPVERQKRQLSGGVSNDRAFISQQGTILDKNGHVLRGGAFASKPLPRGPISAGGNLNYQHTPSGSGAGIRAQHTPHFGTDVSANGNANLWRNQNSRLDAVGSYGRHFGGPYGTGKPQYYGGLQFTSRF